MGDDPMKDFKLHGRVQLTEEGRKQLPLTNRRTGVTQALGTVTSIKRLSEGLVHVSTDGSLYKSSPYTVDYWEPVDGVA